MEKGSSLEREELKQEYQNKIKEIESYYNTKMSLLGSLTHEIRSPLNIISGFTDILYNELLNNLTNNQKEFFGIIIESETNLLNFINELLDFLKINSNKIDLHLDHIKLKDFMIDHVKIYKLQFERKKVIFVLDFDIPDNLSIDVDGIRLKQVLTNLITNAAKYTNEGDKIGVRVGSDADNAIISVWDTGVGINEEDRPYIFDAYRKAHLTSQINYEGTGLGLYYSKKIIELHQGSICLQSTQGKGSEFTIKIPFRNELCKRFWGKNNIILYGLDHAGKTVLTNYFINKFQELDYRPTLGFNSLVGKIYQQNIHIIDSPGQIKYRTMWINHIVDVNLMLYIIDTGDSASIKESLSAFDQIVEHSSFQNIPIFICFHKIDLEGSNENMSRIESYLDRKYKNKLDLHKYKTSIYMNKTMDYLKNQLFDFMLNLNEKI